MPLSPPPPTACLVVTALVHATVSKHKVLSSWQKTPRCLQIIQWHLLELMLGPARWIRTLAADPDDLSSVPGPTPKKERNRSTRLVLWPPPSFKRDCISSLEFQGYLINLFFFLKAYVFCVLPQNLCARLSHRFLYLFASFPGAS